MKTEYLSWSEYLVSELYQMMQEGMILYIMNYYFNMQIKFGQI
jgi:hypothetical protein